MQAASKGELRGSLESEKCLSIILPPPPPQFSFARARLLFGPNVRESGKAKAAKPFVVHPGSKPRLQRPGRWERTLASNVGSSIFLLLTVELAGKYALVGILCMLRHVRWYVGN